MVCLQISQTSQAFPFGSAIVDAQIAGDSEYNAKYQDCFYTHFNWAVHENAMKWGRMEDTQVTGSHAFTRTYMYVHSNLQFGCQF